MELPMRKITAADIAVILLLSAAALFLSLRSMTRDSAETFTVTAAESTAEYPLGESGSLTLTSNGISVNILCEDGKVRIEHSGCPDLTCVRTGAISKPGESIVCVPAELVITIPREKDESDETYIVG